MRRMCDLLIEELLKWPDVRKRAMFGMSAVYRGRSIFAMLPDKRPVERPGVVAYKSRKDETKKWLLFELSEERDLRAALERLAEAYEHALE